MRFLRKHLSTMVLALVMLAGASLVAYPTVSNWWNGRYVSQVMTDYASAVAGGSDEDHAAELAAARVYNEKLVGRQMDVQTDPKALSEYESLLDPAGNGVMGYVSIPRIGVKLPVYHGTDDAVLQVAAGHLYGSSLPVGGIGTHACISGHTGLPRAELFTDLAELELGDVFMIQVLGELLTYEVDDISIVLPEDAALLEIDPGKDYVTLITCTPYGVNSHRLLVRGERIENLPEDEAAVREEIRAANEPHGFEVPLEILIPACVTGILMAIAIVVIYLKRKAR